MGGVQGLELSSNKKIEVTPSTAVNDDFELATVNERAILVEEGATMNEEVGVTAMDDSQEQTNEIQVSVESCEIGISMEDGKDKKS